METEALVEPSSWAITMKRFEAMSTGTQSVCLVIAFGAHPTRSFQRTSWRDWCGTAHVQRLMGCEGHL